MTARATPPLRVGVVLAPGLDEATWQRRHAAGEVVEASPYGLHRLRDLGVDVVFSAPVPPGRPRALALRAEGRLRRSGALHARHTRGALAPATTLYAHMESWGETAMRVAGAGVRTVVNVVHAGSVDRDGGRSRHLSVLERADRLTANAPSTHAWLAGRGHDADLVTFGHGALVRPARTHHERLRRLLVVGNDDWRDWSLTAAVAAARPQLEVLAATDRRPAGLPANVTCRSMTAAALTAAHDAADAALMLARPNAHASGITAVLEHVAHGLPVVATASSDLAHYLADDEMVAVAPDMHAVVTALDDLTAARRAALAGRATERFVTARLDASGFSERLLAVLARTAPAGAVVGEGS